MKPGQESQTAVMVCAARAFADGSAKFAGFSDPTALALLPAVARDRVRRMRAEKAHGVRERFARAAVEKRSMMMVARTLGIDAELREHPAPQLVVLGAGLDGRAWRLPELRDTTVFEVDHPDSQQAKRARTASLTQTAREVRFVSVDFTRDRLDTALGAAGHDATQPTTWIWEGVVMYLTPADVEASLAIVARLSQVGSRLIIAYFCPALMVKLVGPFLRRIGEPIRSVFSKDEMRELLARHGFRVVSDRGLLDIAAQLAPEISNATRPLKHLRVVVAER